MKVGRFYRTSPLLTRILPYFYNAPPSFPPRCRIRCCRMFKQVCNKAAASESPKAYCCWYVEDLSAARTQLQDCFNILPVAEVVKWQTRTFEGRVAQAVRVQVPPSAPTSSHLPDGRFIAGVSGGVGSHTHTPRRFCAAATARTPEIPVQTHEPSDCAGEQAAARSIWVWTSDLFHRTLAPS